MQRPLGVTVTAALMALNLVVDVAHSLMSTTMMMPAAESTGHRTAATIILHAALFGFEAVQIVCVLFYWMGRRWARWLVLVGCLMYIISLKDLRIFWTHSRFSAEMTVAGAALAVYLLWYLHTPRVREWFARDAVADAQPQPAKAL